MTDDYRSGFDDDYRTGFKAGLLAAAKECDTIHKWYKTTDRDAWAARKCEQQLRNIYDNNFGALDALIAEQESKDD